MSSDHLKAHYDVSGLELGSATWSNNKSETGKDNATTSGTIGANCEILKDGLKINQGGYIYFNADARVFENIWYSVELYISDLEAGSN